MGIILNTFSSTAAKVNREDLSGMVSMLTPTDTPLYSMIGKGSAKNTFHEWSTRTLRAPAANAQLEGDQYTYNAVSASVRVGNETQILRESWVVSKTQDKIDNAGNQESSDRAKLEAGLVIRKDLELAFLSNTASVAGTTRIVGGLPSWLTTNVSRGATGANGGYSVGTKLTVAATIGTLRTFTQALLDTVMQSCYDNGANVNVIMASSYLKGVFVSFMANPNVATYRYAVDDGKGNKLISNADWYEGPYGKVKFAPNRIMTLGGALVARNVFLLDTDLLSADWLRPINNDSSVAPNADATAGVMIGEGTLKVENQQGLGVVADVFGLTAST